MGKKWLLILALLFLPSLTQAQADLDISITKTRLDWRTWQFQALGGSTSAIYLWDFGDKHVSDAKEPVHAYDNWGKYKVTLTASEPLTGVGEAQTEIVISFWHIGNIWLQVILGVLGLAAVALVLFIIFDKLPKLKGE